MIDTYCHCCGEKKEPQDLTIYSLYRDSDGRMKKYKLSKYWLCFCDDCYDSFRDRRIPFKIRDKNEQNI